MKLSLCIAWLVCVGAAFVFLLEQQIHPFDENGVYLHTQQATLPAFLSLPLKDSDVQVDASTQIRHWLDPQCSCYRFAKSVVLQQIKNAQADENHLVILKSTDTFWDTQGIANRILTDSEYQQTKYFMPASPAATVHKPKLTSVSYLGPHNSGSYCGQGTSYIDIVMSNLRSGFDPQFVNVNESGCFCNW